MMVEVNLGEGCAVEDRFLSFSVNNPKVLLVLFAEQGVFISFKQILEHAER